MCNCSFQNNLCSDRFQQNSESTVLFLCMATYLRAYSNDPTYFASVIFFHNLCNPRMKMEAGLLVRLFFFYLCYIVELMLDTLLKLFFWWTNFWISDRYMYLWAFSCSLLALLFQIEPYTCICMGPILLGDVPVHSLRMGGGGWNVWAGRSFALDYEMQLQHFNLF